MSGSAGSIDAASIGGSTSGDLSSTFGPGGELSAASNEGSLAPALGPARDALMGVLAVGSLVPGTLGLGSLTAGSLMLTTMSMGN